MDFDRASRILNMDLLGLTPEDFDLSDDDVMCAADDLDDWPTDDDAPGGDNTLTIRYDAQTDIERDLIASAVATFVARRTTAHNVRVELS